MNNSAYAGADFSVTQNEEDAKKFVEFKKIDSSNKKLSVKDKTTLFDNDKNKDELAFEFTPKEDDGTLGDPFISYMPIRSGTDDAFKIRVKYEKDGIEKTLVEQIPEVTGVKDTTDHSIDDNAYY